MSPLRNLAMVMLFTFFIILGGLIYWIIYLSDTETIKAQIESEVPDDPYAQIERQRQLDEKRAELEAKIKTTPEKSKDHAFMNGDYYIQYVGGCNDLCDKYLSWTQHPLTGVMRLIVRPGKTKWRISAVQGEPQTYLIQEQSSCSSGQNACGAYLGIAGERKKEGEDYRYEAGIAHVDTTHGGLGQDGNEIKDFRFSTEKVKIYSHPKGNFSIKLLDLPDYRMAARPFGPEEKDRGWVSFFNDSSPQWKFTYLA